jgi:hypothetical protein
MSEKSRHLCYGDSGQRAYCCTSPLSCLFNRLPEKCTKSSYDNPYSPLRGKNSYNPAVTLPTANNNLPVQSWLPIYRYSPGYHHCVLQANASANYDANTITKNTYSPVNYKGCRYASAEAINSNSQYNSASRAYYARHDDTDH